MEPGSAAHPWPWAGGDLESTGRSSLLGPWDISAPSWLWPNMRAGGITPLVAVDGLVYVYVPRAPHEGGGFVLVLDADGRLERRIGLEASPGVTPALLGGALYTATSDGFALAVDVSTGVEAWRTRYCATCGGDLWSVLAAGSSLVLCGAEEPPAFEGAPSTTHIYALDVEARAVRWRFKPRAPTLSTMPALAGGAVFLQDAIGGVYCLDLETGAARWQEENVRRFRVNCFSGMAVSLEHSLAYGTFNTKGKDASSGQVVAYDVASGAVRWSQALDLEVHSTPAALPTTQGCGTMVVLCLGAYANTVGEYRGQVVALDAQKGKPLWYFDPPPFFGVQPGCKPWCMPLGSGDGLVFLGRNDGTIYALDGDNGEEVSRFCGTGGVQGMALAGGATLVAMLWSNLYALRGSAPERRRRGGLEEPTRRLPAGPGPEHPWPTKWGNDAELVGVCAHGAPTRLARPAWTFAVAEAGAPGPVFCSPLIDALGGVYVSVDDWIICLRPDGTLRLSLWICAQSRLGPALAGESIISANHFGVCYCLSTETGAEVWRTRYSMGGVAGSAGVAVRNGVAVVVGGPGPGVQEESVAFVAGLSVSDGSRLWSCELADFRIHHPDVPFVGDALLLQSALGCVVALGMHDGHVRWRHTSAFANTGFNTGGVAAGPHGLAIYTIGVHRYGMLCALDARTGEEKWSFTGDFLCSTPVIFRESGGRLVCLACTGHDSMSFGFDNTQGWEPSADCVTALDAETGEWLWDFEAGVWAGISPGPRPDKGGWQAGLVYGHIYSAWGTPSVGAGGTVYIGWQGGIIFVLNGSTGEIISRTDPNLPLPIKGSVALAPGRAVFTSVGHVYAFSDEADAGAEPRAGPRDGRDGKGVRRFLVSGGRSTDGIIVRKGPDTKSAKAGRLAFGSVIRGRLEAGGRVHYELLTGHGPAGGWVSLSFKGSELVKPLAGKLEGAAVAAD